MTRHYSLDATQELPADEDRRHHLLALAAGAGEAGEEGMNVGAGSAAVELDDGGANA